MGWCQTKTAYLLDVESVLTDSIDDIFNIITDDLLPKGYSLVQTDISGAAGYVLIFETYQIPLKLDYDQIEHVIKTLEEQDQ